MDPLAMIGLIGTIVQFIDFTSKLISKSGEAYRSVDGTLIENMDLETIINDLITLSTARTSNAESSSGNQALDALWFKCEDVGKELLDALSKLKIQGQKTKWKSFRKALKSVWSRDDIEALSKRLSSFRDELNLRILVELRTQLNFSEIRQSETFQKLDQDSRTILDLIIQQRDVFATITQKQTEKINALHVKSNAIVIDQHNKTRIDVIQAIKTTQESSEADQAATQQEITNLKAAIKELSEQMRKKDAELSQFLKEFRETRSKKKRKALQERSNAVSATLLALEMIYRSLQAILVSIQARALKALEPLKESYNWRVFTYPSQRNQSSRPPRRKVASREPTMIGEGNVIAVLEYDDKAHYSEAVDLYYAYFYQNLHSRNKLVDVEYMHQRWPPLSTIDINHRLFNKNEHGFVVQRNTPGLSSIWIMALLISALDAWEANSSFEFIGKVFQKTEGELLAQGSFIESGCRGKQLQSDMNFWKVHAKDRGIDEAMKNRFKGSRVLSSFSRNGKNQNLLVDFLSWLLAPATMKEYYSFGFISKPQMHRQSIMVKRPILEIATVLQDFGLAIAIEREGRSPPDQEDPYAMPIVILQSSLTDENLTESITWNNHWHLDDVFIDPNSKEITQQTLEHKSPKETETRH